MARKRTSAPEIEDYRHDDTGEANRLPALLKEAKDRLLTDDEAQRLVDALCNHEPWYQTSGF